MENASEKKGWLARNWKWLVPVGGCGTILACLGCLAIIFVTVFGVIKSSDIYQQSLVMVQGNPKAIAVLGTPIKVGFLPSGSIDVEGSSGQADFAIPVSGPKASGKVYVVAAKSAGKWRFTTFELVLDDVDKPINLMPGNK